MSDYNKEKLLNLYPIPITIDCTKIILEQMENCICKINNEKGNGTGFFCFISNYNKYIMLTNNHVIDEEVIKNNNKIIVTINDDKEKIEINLNDKKLYTNKKYDVTIIEIKEEEKNKIKKYIELDNNIFDDNSIIYNETLYILQYPKFSFNKQKGAVSYGILKGFKDEYNIIHLCSTEPGSSGSPILNISNNKVIGIHKEGSNKYNYNIGTYLKYPINEYLNNINLIQKTNTIKNEIKDDFIFHDSKGNKMDKEDKKDFSAQDILNNDSNKLKIKIKGGKMEAKKEIDFSKYKIIKKREEFTIYQYSNINSVSNQPLVNQYFYDHFENIDYQNSYIILFLGKTGEGKTTAINAFFNIIKGINIEDNYRFILINEQEKPKKTITQTDGIHLYYVRDYNNKPIIIIDSQGYGDTRGKEYDNMINEKFNYVFSNIIDHINLVSFISKSNNNRIDEITRNTFCKATGLFDENIFENFIFLLTFATKDIESEGPSSLFIEYFQQNEKFLKIS